MQDKPEQIAGTVENTVKDVLEYNVFSIGKYSLSLYEIIAAAIIVVLGIVVSKLIKKLIYKSEKIDIGRKFAFSRIISYLIYIVVFLLVMKSLGVNISPLLLGSGAILVGVGLGLQNLILDFISGVIILIDRTIRVGDVVDIDGTVGKVQEIQMRTTTILTRDNKSIIFPNSELTKNKLINFSHKNDEVRFSIQVGVGYETEIEKAEQLMIEAALEQNDVLKDPKPSVRLHEFGDSSLNLQLIYDSQNLFRQPQIQSNIRKAILKKFRENNINIPFPIRTLDLPKDIFPGKENSKKAEN